MINFFTFKWGEKYGPEYVNRLYGALKKHVDVPFNLTCITDDSEGVHSDIDIIDYNTFDPWDYPKDRIFTREKIVLMKRFKEGNNFWLDLDLLIQDNITHLVTRTFEKPTFIWNYWNWDKGPEKQAMAWYGKGVMCYVNSSFVGWTGDCGEFIYDFVDAHQDICFYTYKSLDKFLFYQMHRCGKLDFWERGLFYNYNFDVEKFAHMEGYVASIFNTSHIKANNIQGVEALEIHETDNWAKTLWESYDA